MTLAKEQTHFLQLTKLNKLDDALVYANKLLESHPKNALVYNMLGDVFLKKNDLNNACTCYQQSVELAPLQVQVLLTLGKIYEVLGGGFEQALTQYLKALELEPNNTKVLCRVAEFLASIGHFDDAKSLINKAIGLKDSFAYSVLLSLYDKLGERDSIRALVDEQNHYFSSLNNTSEFLAFVKALYFIGEYTKAIEKLNNVNLSNSSDSWLCLYYKLKGDCYERVNNFDKAFQSYQAMNKFTPAHYDAKSFEELATRCKNIASTLPKTNQTISNIEAIFIVGMPRTGTSLLEKILSTQHNVFAGGELGLIDSLYQNVLNPKHSVPDLLKHYYQQLSHYVTEHSSTEKQFVIDKMPTNYFYIGLIRQLMPNAKILYCQRNALDTAFSIYKQNFNPQVSFATSFDDIAHFMQIERDLMQYWQTQYPENIFQVNLESLVTDFEQQTQAIFNYLGLKWSKDVEQFYKQKTFSQTASYNQVRQPINSSIVSQYEGYQSLLEPFKNLLPKS